MAQVTFEVPETLGGKTLGQLGPQYDFGAEANAQRLGISPSAALTPGQLLTYTSDDPTYYGEGGFLGLSKAFGSPVDPFQAAIKPAVKSLQESIPETQQKFATERSRLTGEIDPLKQRYQTLIDDLTRKETREKELTTQALGNEFSRRGIPLSSGLYEQTGLERTQPISEFFGIQQREAVGERESGLRQLQNLIAGLVPQETEATRAIRNAIAQMQAGAGKDTIENAFRQLQFNEGQRQFNAQQALSQQKFDFEKLLAQSTKQPENQYATLSEGQTLLNLLTGQPVYTNPKTYKPSSQFGGNDWEYA